MSRRVPLRTASLGIVVLCFVFCVVPAPAGDWTMLPDDVQAVFHFDMAALLRSELYGSIVEKYGSQIRNPTGPYLDFVESTGFDVETDLRTVTFGAGSADDDGPIYLIVTGDFDMEKITAFAKNSGAVRVGNYGDLTTYVPVEIETQGPPPTAAFLDASTLIVATTPDFPKLVESVRGSGLRAEGSSLGRLLAGAKGQFYLAVELPRPAADGGNSPAPGGNGLRSIVEQLQSPQAGPLGSLQTLLVTLEAGSGLDLAVQASTDTPENGQMVFDMLNGYLTMGRSVAAQQNPQAAGILDHLQLERSGATVEIGLSMSGEEVHRALEQVPEEPEEPGAGS